MDIAEILTVPSESQTEQATSSNETKFPLLDSKDSPQSCISTHKTLVSGTE